MSRLSYGSYTTAPYSSVDLTSEIYASLLQSSEQYFKFRLKNPSVEFAFLVILVICVFHCKSSDIVSPKYGFESTCSRISFSS